MSNNEEDEDESGLCKRLRNCELVELLEIVMKGKRKKKIIIGIVT